MLTIFNNSNEVLWDSDWIFVDPTQADNIQDLSVMPNNIGRIVHLPHAWNEMGWNYENYSLDEPEGTGWYFKRISGQSCMADKIKFEGVSAEAEVFINGQKIGHNLGAYRAFEVPLFDLQKNGDDVVAVKVKDKPSAEKISESDDPFSISPRYKRWAVAMGSSLKAGGIWRNVYLVKSARGRIETPRICPTSLLLHLSTSLIDESNDGNSELKYELFDDNGLVAEESAFPEDTCILKCPDAKTWSFSDPILYKLKTTVFVDGEKTQTILQPVAFRNFTIRGSEFYLNGRPYFLRGQNGFPHCNIPHDREYIRRYVSRVKDQGVEISRFHTEPPSHAWLDECDRQGIMVILEMPLHGSMGCYPLGTEEFQENYKKEMVSIIKEYRRHPSIVIWSLGNEILVSAERDRGLAPAVFDIIEEWVEIVHSLDHRPVIPNSGGDGAEMVQKTVGDVDDMHHYGGWYTETLFDLRNCEKVVRKNDMLFKPSIVTESVAAYTNQKGEFCIDGQDSRQQEVVKQRVGLNADLSRSTHIQAFILKEYAEAMWRMRRNDTNLSGFIPFGQYTWFYNPFDKGSDGLKDKTIWKVYRKLMGPVHVQMECWHRNCYRWEKIPLRILLCHEDTSLPQSCEFTVTILASGQILYKRECKVHYHDRFSEFVDLQTPFSAGENRIEIKAERKAEVISENYLDVKIYDHPSKMNNSRSVIYDPAGKLEGIEGCSFVSYAETAPLEGVEKFVVGPFAVDHSILSRDKDLREWCKEGGKLIILEQLPGSPLTEDMFSTGIGLKRLTHPYWSRWSRNMVKHTDRADMVSPDHPIFKNVQPEELCWWNGDTFVAHAYLSLDKIDQHTDILAGVCNGLGDNELMPVKYGQMNTDYNLLAVSRQAGEGEIIFCNLLVGSKCNIDPVAQKILLNILS